MYAAPDATAGLPTASASFSGTTVRTVSDVGAGDGTRDGAGLGTLVG